MTDTDIHSCGYYCDRHACILRQRDELRDKLFSEQAVKTYSGGKPNYTQPIEREPILPGGGIGTSWDNTMCNPLANARMQTQSAWQDGYDSAKAELAGTEPAECDGGQCGIGGYCKECPKGKPNYTEPCPRCGKVNPAEIHTCTPNLTTEKNIQISDKND